MDFESICLKCNETPIRTDFKTRSVYHCPKCFDHKTTELFCEHDLILIRFELINGNTQLREYCKKCNWRSPQALPQKKYEGKEIHKRLEKDYVEYTQRIWELDKDVYLNHISRLRQEQEKVQFADYHKYLLDDHWVELRKKIISRDAGICQICGNKAEIVHHLTYAHIHYEKDFELISLCQKCHWNEYHSPDAKKRENSILLPPNNE